VDLRGLGRLAWLLDEALPIPGTSQRIGVDAVLGLIPGVGDALGALLSTYIIIEAARRGASPWLVTRMLGNVAIETLIGVVPVAGDVFDVVWKANSRNLRLLGDTLERAELPRDPRPVLRLAGVLIVATVLALMVGTALLSIALYRVLVS
jgi:hypothetical protein